MHLLSSSFVHGQRIPAEFAFCAPDPTQHVRMSGNRNPHLRWTGVPSTAKSLVLLCVDVDVPTRADDVNQEGRSVPADLPRTSFWHWVLVDIPPSVSEIPAGSASEGITARGKGEPRGPKGSRQGLNDYTHWFAGDKDMAGEYFGYDGPCPPWNDEIIHHYVFTVYALDVEKLPVDGKFGGPEVRAAMQGHILAEASLAGTYTLNASLLA